MYETFKRFADEILFAARGADPYLQSHPMPARARRRAGRAGEDQPLLGQEGSARAAAAPRHDARQALRLHGPRRHGARGAIRCRDNSLPARYARAIATYRHGDLRAALAQIDALIQTQPNNPYFHELKGQALLEGGKPAEAIAPLRQAVQLAPNPALIQMMLAQALVATDNPSLRRRGDRASARRRWRASPKRRTATPSSPWPMAARAIYAQADLASAQAAFLRGDNKTARELAARAKTRFADRLARLGQGRRHRQRQAAASSRSSAATDSKRTHPMSICPLRLAFAAALLARPRRVCRGPRAELFRRPARRDREASSANT